MKNVYIYCEGPSEESFVNNILTPFFAPMQIYTIPIICKTSNKHHQKFKGGILSYEKIKNELRILCKEHQHEFVTTFIDYYGMPHETPGLHIQADDLYEHIHMVEQCIQDDVGMGNLDFHFSLHEFEGLLFSQPEAFELITGPEIVEQIKLIRIEFENPEYINNDPETAPSKRILKLIPNYAKVRYGTELSELIGLERMRSECPHFNRWIKTIMDR